MTYGPNQTPHHDHRSSKDTSAAFAPPQSVSSAASYRLRDPRVCDLPRRQLALSQRGVPTVSR